MKTYRKDVHATLNGRAITISVAVTAEEEDNLDFWAQFLTKSMLSGPLNWLGDVVILHTRGPVEVPDA